MARKTYWVYILTNRSGTLYVGMTSNLSARLGQHREGIGSKFASQYKTARLIYTEAYTYVWDAINRERQLKGWTRRRKVALINEFNPSWRDMSNDLF